MQMLQVQVATEVLELEEFAGFHLNHVKSQLQEIKARLHQQQMYQVPLVNKILT